MYILQIVVCSFVPFLLTIELSVLLRYTNYDYAFGIFKLFLLLFAAFKQRIPQVEHPEPNKVMVFFVPINPLKREGELTFLLH
jgi:hypothetical protein